ncbi:tyrosine-type recombinase/integrase [Dactylosporangium sp. NPDC051485]|uniref:tyrosine-type recombinase/integrase n=1 Tax=Dactylosporangium sp. NPDC051485 TaxID=3154846 RepID=UPI003434A4DE
MPPLKAADASSFDRRRGARKLLAWLASFPGQTWQQRWLASGAEDLGRGWLEHAVGWLNVHWPTGVSAHGKELLLGNPIVAGSGVIRPGYGWLLRQNTPAVLHAARQCMDPDGFAQVDAYCAANSAITTAMRQWVLRRLTWIVIAKAGTVADITVGDFLELHQAERAIRNDAPAAALTYQVLRHLEVFPAAAPASLRAAFTPGPRSVAELIDQYQLACQPVRDLLIDYISERCQGMDYSTRRQLVIVLGKLFWADLEDHHPGIDTLHLPPELAAAWKQRLDHVRSKKDGRIIRERHGKADVLITVRSLYLDLAQWAIEEPSRWGPWVAPCPISAAETNTRKRDAHRKARIDQRTRERLPVLPALVRTAEQRMHAAKRTLDAALATTPGATLTIDGQTFRRPNRKKTSSGVRVWADDASGKRRDLAADEEYAFWAWAAIEVLRHTGIRIEELLELTHHSFVTYKLPTTGEIVPLLQIAPSKLDKERLLLVTPELGEVLTAIIYRVRAGAPALPLVSAYHTADQVWSPPMPFLFQRPHGHEQRAIPYITIRTMLDATLAATGLTDAAEQPLRFVPHDFRRIFITDAIMHGLPPHIAQVLVGHADINTTIGYKAAYPTEAINTYRGFLARRRQARPSEEYRDITPEEWDEFLGHFAKRKVSIGDCGREYGTGCQHEHACIRCPLLRPDPAQKTRLQDIRSNLLERIDEARNHGWLGEVEGLQATLAAADQKLAAMDVLANRQRVINLGMPDLHQAAGTHMP